jgi:hypothetical protein
LARRSRLEPERFDDEFRLVLMFSLTGLAISLLLAAKVHVMGDVLAGMAMSF